MLDKESLRLDLLQSNNDQIETSECDDLIRGSCNLDCMLGGLVYRLDHGKIRIVLRRSERRAGFFCTAEAA